MKLFVLDSNTWNHLTVREQLSSGAFKNNVTKKLFVYKSHTHVCGCCKQGLALNNPQELMYHKTQLNQTLKPWSFPSSKPVNTKRKKK